MIDNLHAKISLLDTSATRYERGVQYLNEKRFHHAVAEFNNALKINPHNLDVIGHLGFALLMTGNPQLALSAYQLGLQLQPNNLAMLRGMASCYWALGEFDKAAGYHAKILKVQPENVDSLYNLALKNGHPRNSPLLTQLQKLHACAQCKNAERVLVCFALAKLYEEWAEHSTAFDYYREGNQLQFALLPFDEAAFFAYFDALEATFDNQLLARLRNETRYDVTPIFVLGMPRSGTSLVEQILASHSSVCGTGEIDVMPNVADIFVPQATGQPYPVGAQKLSHASVKLLAQFYINHLQSYNTSQRPFAVDKTINNFFHVGLIRILFPHAPIIQCVRDPMDNCWSLYRQYFVGNVPYCYDMPALGRFYRRYEKLMQHWHLVLPCEMHVVRYENMVQKPEETIHALLNYCRLPWEDNCLNFYRTKRSVNTASALQVRRPIYKTSLNSWVPVADKLEPLRMALQSRD